MITYHHLLTLKASNPEKDLLNSRGSMYSLHERGRQSEAASRGRAQMGSAAVTPKQLMQQLHSMLGGGEGAKPLEDKFNIKRQLWDNKSKKYIWKEYTVVIKPKTQSKWRKFASEVGRAQIAFSSDPMDELGLKTADNWFKALHNAHFNVTRIVNPKTGKKVPSNELSYTDLTAWDLKKGLYETLDNLNRAYWGKNYQEGRRYSMDEIRSMTEGIYALRSEQRNNFLMKVGEKLQPLDWSDNVIGRMDRKAVLDMYKQINIDGKNPEWKFLLKLMERTSFTVPESKHLLQAIWAKDRHGDLIRLYDSKRREEIARDTHLFEDAIDMKTVNQKNGLYINKELLAKAFTGTKEQYIKARERILSDIMFKAEDYFINDLNDMATFRNITKLAKNMTTEELSIIPDLHKFAEKLKNNSYLMAKERNKIAAFDWSSLSKEQVGLLRAYMNDKDIGHLIPKQFKALKEQPSATLDRAKIDKEIFKFRKDNKLNAKQAQMLDYLLLGTYRRGNLSDIAKLQEQLKGADPALRDLLSHLRSLAARTSMSKLGYNSEALSNQQSMVDMIGSVTHFINESWRPPSKVQVEKVQKFAEDFKKNIKDTKVDLLEETLIDEIEFTTGFEGLKEGVEIAQVPKKLRERVLEIQANIQGENNKFKQNFNEVVRSLLGKDLNTLNPEDYNVLNNWFRDVKKGTIWQQIFGDKTATKLAKRHHWLFPKTINRELMRDDIQLMEENGMYVAKGGRVLTGKLMRPTQHIDMVQSWIARTMDNASKVSEEKIQDIKELL